MITDLLPIFFYIDRADPAKLEQLSQAVQSVLTYNAKHGLVKEWHRRNQVPLPPWTLKRVMEEVESCTREGVNRELDKEREELASEHFLRELQVRERRRQWRALSSTS